MQGGIGLLDKRCNNKHIRQGMHKGKTVTKGNVLLDVTYYGHQGEFFVTTVAILLALGGYLSDSVLFAKCLETTCCDLTL